MAFAAMALVVFFMAVGYSNNLIYIFVFLLISLGITSAFVTNQNIKNINVANAKVLDAFVNEEGRIVLDIRNESTKPCWDLEFTHGKKNPLQGKISLTEKTPKEFSYIFKPTQRGWQKLERLTLQSRFPFQLLRAWKYYVHADDILIYAEKIGDTQFPQEAFADDALSNAGLFRDHRSFQPSDSVNRIDWRASARRQSLHVKNYEEAEKPVLSFNWEQTQHLEDFEKRISQLTLWVDQAYIRGHDFSLKIGKTVLPQMKDYQHRCVCLEALATLQRDQV